MCFHHAPLLCIYRSALSGEVNADKEGNEFQLSEAQQKERGGFLFITPKVIIGNWM